MVVIGGSRGIGASVVRLAAKSGYRVALGFSKQKLVAQAVIDEVILGGGYAKAISLDVADCGSVSSFFDQAATAYGLPDAVAICAGVPGPRCALADMNPDDITALFSVNLIGTFFCVREAAKRMMLSHGGRGGAIVTLSSEAARFGGNRISAYAASKAGINAMTIGVARELAPQGIRLNCVSPGVIETDLQAEIPTEGRASLISSIPAGRMGRPEEVANAVLWLLSGESSYVTGTVLTVAGGR